MKNNLRRIMNERGLKHKWVEEKVGMSHASFSALVNEKSEPTLRTARRIARVLEMDDKEIWPEDDAYHTSAQRHSWGPVESSD